MSKYSQTEYTGLVQDTLKLKPKFIPQIFFHLTTQTTWQVLGKVATSLSTVLILGLATRSYGAEGVGIFTLALTFISLFYLAIDLGINTYFLPDLLAQKNSVLWQQIFGSRLIFSLTFSVVVFLIACFWPGLNLQYREAIMFGIPAIMAYSCYVSTSAIFQAQQRFDLVLLATVLQSLLTLLIFNLQVWQKIPVPFLMLSYGLGWICCAVVSLVLVQKYVQITPLFQISFIKNIFLKIWPISATLLLNTIYFRADAFILSASQSFFDVGVYNLAYQLFQTALVIPTFIMNSFYPILITKFQADKIKFLQYFKVGIISMLILSFLGVVMTQLFSPLIIQLIAGNKEFGGSINSLKILSFGFPAFFMSSILMWALILIKSYKSLVGIYAVGLLVNIILNLILIPHFSYVAASWVTVFSEYLILICQLVILTKQKFFTPK